MIFNFWITKESLVRLISGGNNKGTVPIHFNTSNTAKIPVFVTISDEEYKYIEKQLAQGISVYEIVYLNIGES